jgi:hypothetical protein
LHDKLAITMRDELLEDSGKVLGHLQGAVSVGWWRPSKQASKQAETRGGG